MTHDRPWWDLELAFIRSIDPVRPTETFNRKRSVFAAYCDMQAKAAKKDGHTTIATAIHSIREEALAD